MSRQCIVLRQYESYWTAQFVDAEGVTHTVPALTRAEALVALFDVHGDKLSIELRVEG